MTKFDFVECASQAYQYCWKHRGQIARLSAGFIVFKCVSFLIVLNLFSDQNILRQNLLMMPAYLYEGLIIAKIIGCAQGRGREGQNPAMFDLDEKAAAVTYALIKLFMFFLGGMTVMEQQKLVASGAEPTEPNALTFLLAIGILGALIWGFRLIWIYVPLAMGFSIRKFLISFKGFVSSFHMIGTWIICFAPLGLALIIISQMLAVILGVPEEAPPGGIYINLAGLIQVVLDFMMSMVSSLGLAYAFLSVLDPKSARLKK